MTVKKTRFGGGGVVQQYITGVKGLLQTSQMPTAYPADPPIQVSRWARNGKHPNAVAESMKSAAGNAAALMKTKEAFHSWGGGGNTSHGYAASSGVSCTRWRCAFHTGPFTQFLDVQVMQVVDAAFGTAASYSQLDITEVATAAVTTQVFPVGGGLQATLASQYPVTARMVCKPNTDYTAVFTDFGTDMRGATIVEMSSLTTYNGGYLPQNNAAGGAILDGYRQNSAQLLRDLWQKGGWPLFNWSIEDGTLPVATTSFNFTNLCDATVDTGTAVTTAGSSTVSPNSAGFVLDTTGRGRRSQVAVGGGIPIVIGVYGSCDVSFSAYLQVVNSSGVAVASNDEFLTSTPGWSFFTGFLPINVVDKYDIRIHTDPATTSKFHAVSIYELG